DSRVCLYYRAIYFILVKELLPACTTVVSREIAPAEFRSVHIEASIDENRHLSMESINEIASDLGRAKHPFARRIRRQESGGIDRHPGREKRAISQPVHSRQKQH